MTHTKSQTELAEEIFLGKNYPQRTPKQHRALHLFFTILSDAFNESGLTVKDILEVINIGVKWTPVSVKESFWKPIQKALLNKESTKDLNTIEITKVVDVITEALGTRIGFEMPEFPSEEQTQAYLNSLKPQG